MFGEKLNKNPSAAKAPFGELYIIGNPFISDGEGGGHNVLHQGVHKTGERVHKIPGGCTECTEEKNSEK